MNQQVRMIQQMICFQRSVMNLMIKSALISWYRMDNVVGSVLEKSPWFPKQGRKVLREWSNGNKKAFVIFWDAVDRGFNNMGNQFALQSEEHTPYTAPPETYTVPPVKSKRAPLPYGLLELPGKPVHHETAANVGASAEREAPLEETAEKHKPKPRDPWIVRGY